MCPYVGFLFPIVLSWGVLRSRLIHYNKHIMRLAVTVEVKLVTMVD